MNDSGSITRYLLGDLPEDEQTALEARYVADPRVFDEVAKIESDLVDDYVRGKLAADVRERFERVYLATPERRERVRFAEALVTRVDRAGASPVAGVAGAVAAEGGWQAWLDALRAPKPALGLAFATLILASGVWLVFEVRRTRHDVVRQEAARADQERRDRATQGQTVPPPPERTLAGSPPSTVVLALTVGAGARAPDSSSPTPLVIPADAADVRLELSLRDREYPTYRVILRAVGGADVMRRDRLVPAPAGSPATIALTVAASQLQSGDYILTLQGATRNGEYDDVSQSLIRVDKK